MNDFSPTATSLEVIVSVTSLHCSLFSYACFPLSSPLEHFLSHLFQPVWLAGWVRPLEEANEFTFISLGEGDQSVLWNPQPKEWNVDLTKQNQIDFLKMTAASSVECRLRSVSPPILNRLPLRSYYVYV